MTRGRPKKGTPEGDLATQRWRESVARNHGSPTEMMKKIGAIGGSKKVPKGFAMLDEETRKGIASRGGYNSRRNRVDNSQ